MLWWLSVFSEPCLFYKSFETCLYFKLDHFISSCLCKHNFRTENECVVDSLTNLSPSPQLTHEIRGYWAAFKRFLKQTVPYYMYAMLIHCWLCKGGSLCKYYIRHIFCESNFSRIGTARHFREWLNLRSRRRAIMDGGQRNQYHSLICMCTVYCTTSIAHICKSHCCIGIGGKFIFGCCWIHK